MSKLRYSVSSCSSADPEFPAAQLNVHSPHTRGWQTPRFCEYPQHVIIEFASNAAISQIQLLSHQHKIVCIEFDCLYIPRCARLQATRIEIFVGSGPVDGIQPSLWTRLGYMSLDANERSQYQARELKSVYVDAQGRYLFNQVGIIALNVLGKYTNSDPTSCHVHGRGEVLMSHGESIHDLSFDLNVDARAAQLIRSLLAAKEAAIEAEDYDAAKRLKIAERELHALGGQLAQLEISKRRAARDEDFDRAKLLKNEIMALQRRIHVALRDYHIEPPANAQEEYSSLSPPLTPQGGMMATDALKVAVEHISPGSPTDKAISNSLREHAPSPPKEGASLPHLAEADQGASASLPPISPEPESRPLEQDDITQNDGTSETCPSATPSATKQALRSYSQVEDEISSADIADIAQSVPLETVDALAGVPNAAELPVPESLVADVGANVDIASVRAILGDYRARCLLSKNWALREASLAKTRLLVYENHWEHLEDFSSLCDVARLGVTDKIAQVYLTALALIEDIAHKIEELGIKHADALSVLEPVLSAVIMKLGENQPRLRDKAVDSLTALSQCGVVGADWLAERVMLSLEKKRPHNKWRPIATRLSFLKRLAINFGVEHRDSAKKNPGAPLVLESLISFVERHGCASHTFEEVRTATKDLMVTIFVIVSMEDRTRHLDPFLAKLRPKQIKEYQHAIDLGLAEQAHESELPLPDSHKKKHHWITSDEVSPGAAAALNDSPGKVPPSPAINPISFSKAQQRNGDNESLHSDDLEEERFRDQIMKQLEEKAFSVQEAYEILKEHFRAAKQNNPIKESVLAEWVSEVGSDACDDDSKQTRDEKLWKVATWLFQ
mmetsp:Transcript_22355/g.69027  ORF Transcript_22355/g.69027 Transcript_22355/m.69027 type:complete len:845 (+) Transcript_22355:500-3034(+)